jgi:hypothetical protein
MDDSKCDLKLGTKKMKSLFAIITVLVLCVSCSDESRSREVLQRAGYKDIQITGYTPFYCGEDDHFSTGFKANNPRGQEVSGVVCCGVIKGCTIRF